MFKLNDYVLYPGHGVALIEEITEKMIGGRSISFLKLMFSFRDMMILVPTYNVETTGIRMPSSKQHVAEALMELYKRPEKKADASDFTPSGWNKRHKEYQAVMARGVFKEMVKVYRDLMYISQEKELSFGEKTVLGLIEELVAQEIQVVESKDREMVIQMMRIPFKSVLRNQDEPCHVGSAP